MFKFVVLAFLFLVFGTALGFPTNSTLTGLATNAARDLGDYSARCVDSSFDANDCRRYGDYSRFSYDSDNHQLLLFGGGHSSTMRDDIDVFTFNNLAWKSAYASTRCAQMTSVATNGTWSSTGHPVARHTYDQLIYAPNTHRLIMTSGVYGAGYCGTYAGCGEWCAGKMHRYDPIAKTWSPSNVGANSSHVWSAEYDPVSGNIISAGGGGLLVYNPTTDAQTQPLSSSSISGYADNLVYFPPNQKMYYIARGSPTRVWEITLNRTTWAGSTIVEVTGMSGSPNTQESGFAYDTLNHIIGGGVLGGKFFAFNPPTKAWTTKTIAPVSGTAPDCYSHCLDFDPVDNVFIYYGTDFHTWAYRYAIGTTVEKQSMAPVSNLLDVSPNPFNLSSRIEIKSGTLKSGFTLKITDISGRLIQDLTSRVDSDGKVSWKPALKSGIYIVSFTQNNLRISKCVTLLK